MTKERKLAIEMWEFVLARLGVRNAYHLKQIFAAGYPEIDWQNDCWFCQYCRRDYRKEHPGREGLDHERNNCELCPIFKYEQAHGNYPLEEDACGCDEAAWHEAPLYARAEEGDKEAARIILRLLKGEKV